MRLYKPAGSTVKGLRRNEPLNLCCFAPAHLPDCYVWGSPGQGSPLPHFFLPLPLTILPLLSWSEVSLLSSRDVDPITDWTWMASIPQVPNRTYGLPPALLPSVSKDSKAFHGQVPFKGLPCWVLRGKWEMATVSRGRCQIRKESHRPCQHVLRSLFFLMPKMILKCTVFLSSEKLMLFYNFWQDRFYSWVGSVNLPYAMMQFLPLGFNIYNPPKHTHLGLLPPATHYIWRPPNKVQPGVQSPSRAQPEGHNRTGRHTSQSEPWG